MKSFVTPWATVASSKSSSGDGLFNPLTPWMDSTGIRFVRFAVDVQGRFDCNVCVGVEWSEDGITWNPANGQAVGWDGGTATWKSTEGWTYGNGYVDTSALSKNLLFIRFGVYARTSSGTTVRNAQVRLRCDLRPVNGAHTYAAGPLEIASGTNATPRFYAMTQAIPTQSLNKVRGSWRMDGDTGGADIRGAYQTSDDGVTWSAATALDATYLSADGPWYNSSGFTTVDFSASTYVRFGMQIKQSASAREMCQASLRVDVRND